MKTKTLALSSTFLSLGLVLPFLTGQIPQIGVMLLPMHIPVILCGLICGPMQGLMVGLLTPLLRSLLFSMPPFYPTALAMSAELAAYGWTAGFLYHHSRWSCLWALYKSLLAAMLAGRMVYGLSMLVLLGLNGSAYTMEAFITGAFLSGLPGIVLQLVLIPAVMLLLHKTGMVPLRKVEVNRVHASIQ